MWQNLHTRQNWYVVNTYVSKATTLKMLKSLIVFALDRSWFINLKWNEYCNKAEHKNISLRWQNYGKKKLNMCKKYLFN